MNKKMISFIGGGNMATAIISGILSSGLSDSDHICATAAHESSVIRLKETLHIEATTDNKAAAQKADILFLAIKPNMFHKVCLLYTSPSPRDRTRSRMPSSA